MNRPAASSLAPAIGADWQGGIYAGVSVHANQPVHLILLPGEEKTNWKSAGEWAAKQGGVLPSRIDQLVLFKHLKGEFQDAWYWSGEPFAGTGDEGFAWSQGFGYGGSHYYRMGGIFRARAVCRFATHSFQEK